MGYELRTMKMLTSRFRDSKLMDDKTGESNEWFMCQITTQRSLQTREDAKQS